MWYLFLLFCLLKTGFSHIAGPDELDDLDYSHNIFIPINAYGNYELFAEFAKGSDLGKALLHKILKYIHSTLILEPRLSFVRHCNSLFRTRRKPRWLYM